MTPSTRLCSQVHSALSAETSDEVFLVTLVPENFQSQLEPGELDQLEDQLVRIYHDLVQSQWQTELFLKVLHALCPILPASSLITRWWDYVLRPALRDPKLSSSGVECAKDLIAHIQGDDSKVEGFRRRLLDLYLLNAFNESSGDDILEWAGLSDDERSLQSWWKSNLEDVLLTFGAKWPNAFMSHINDCFLSPSSRLQLLTLLNAYTSLPVFESLAAVLATHPLMSSLLTSLQLDNSSTVCTLGLSVVVRLCPIFAVTSCEDLKSMLPRLLAILGRVTSWKERRGPTDESPEDEASGSQDFLRASSIPVNPDLIWERLELTFNATASSAPPPREYFSALYYLFPCNVLRFLRGPATYLKNENPTPTPYTVDWEEALDEQLIRSKSDPLLRGHMCHPLLIYRDAEDELAKPDFWAPHNVSRIVSETTMLDVRNAVLGQREQLGISDAGPDADIHAPRPQSDDDGVRSSSPALTLLSPEATAPARISLQDMIATSVALKSSLNLEVIKPTSAWSSSLFPTTSVVPQEPALLVPSSSSDDVPLPTHVAQAISVLQREVLLLRNEMNFELWLSRENMKHIGRLYEDRVVSKNAEKEQQILHNKLRASKNRVAELQTDLREERSTAQEIKKSAREWNNRLLEKQKAWRAEQKTMSAEMAQLRDSQKQADAKFSAQGQLLAEATQHVFDLSAERKENQPKVERLKDYEAQIAQHVKMQRLWDEDFKRFNERGEHMEVIVEEYEKTKLRLQSVEQMSRQLEESSRADRRQIKALEARLAAANGQIERSAQMEQQLALFATERRDLRALNTSLRSERDDLKIELDGLVEEMRSTGAGVRDV